MSLTQTRVWFIYLYYILETPSRCSTPCNFWTRLNRWIAFVFHSRVIPITVYQVYTVFLWILIYSVDLYTSTRFPRVRFLRHTSPLNSLVAHCVQIHKFEIGVTRDERGRLKMKFFTSCDGMFWCFDASFDIREKKCSTFEFDGTCDD